MIKLMITNSKGTFDITQLVTLINWSGDYKQCARTLEFGLVTSSTDKNIPIISCELGNGVVFMQDNRVLFEGFIFERQKNSDNSIINITCYDRGIYLKRNEATYRFTGSKPEAIAKRICTDFGIPEGSIVNTGISVSRNFVGISLYNIILTAYTLAAEKTGKQYMIRFNGSKMDVIEKKVTDETLIIDGESNLMSTSATESITSMINQVTVYNSKDVLIRTIKNDEAIKLYGLMQNYMKQPKGEDVTAKAKRLLEDNGVTQKITVNSIGNIANITGGTVVIREPFTGQYGLFYIDNDIHTWKLGQYYNKLILNFKNIMDAQDAGSLPNKDGKKTASWDYLFKPGGAGNGE